ncbi:hypothetical protein [Anditalea andensis]|uniref:Uncharacterized protein n=1 Tax=Anditalea andensis TaxID=1048983 RepID=A0A074L5V6_9BACT|nr:hypothetical protein [Anditalea andensis]KEO75885.1 hypothetical protein EL17_22975 [Anditalea andensis]
MDIGTIVYIVLVIIYFIFTAFKKKNAPEQEERYEGEEAGEKRPASFEDMLRDIRREQHERERDIEHAGQGDVADHKYQDRKEDTFETNYEPWEEKPAYKQPEPARSVPNKYYDDAEGSLKNYDRKPLVKLDDQIDLDSDEKILGEVEDVAEEYGGKNKYGHLLKSPESVRDAVILTEILNRKY